MQKGLRTGAGVLAVAALAGGAWFAYDAAISQPIREVRFSGPMERLDPAELDAFARALKAATPRPSLAQVREAARHIAWVRDAAVRRRFPDSLEVRFEVHEPLARWNDASLVSARGEIFRATTNAELPKFFGPDAGAATMARQYPAIARALEPLASPLAELRLSARGAWQVTLASGLALELGRGDIETRLARFVSAWPELAAQGVATSHADLRYANGFALRRALSTPKTT
jgi:cell division protein FtsQ